MKLGAQERHRTNPVSTPAKVAAAAAPLRRENHTSGAAPRGAAPRAPRRRARCSGAAAPRLPAAQPLRGRLAAERRRGAEQERRRRKGVTLEKNRKNTRRQKRGGCRVDGRACALSHDNGAPQQLPGADFHCAATLGVGGAAAAAPPAVSAAANRRGPPAPPPRVAPGAAARPDPARLRGVRAATCARPGSAGRSCPASEAGRGGARMGPACRALELVEEGSGRRESPRCGVVSEDAVSAGRKAKALGHHGVTLIGKLHFPTGMGKFGERDWGRGWLVRSLIALLGLKSAQTEELHRLKYPLESRKTLNPLSSQENRMTWSDDLNGYFPAILVLWCTVVAHKQAGGTATEGSCLGWHNY
ncbi:uncharacterized protein LOC102062072 [Zonotrichia albicollis]|uniref:uncharacterized protein LOC102062072 n=1 Tax=Zonotrichia albicollis TaxID=44394 RepID=UPI0003942B06|nr:atherin [Zonotrichia albicollis]